MATRVRVDVKGRDGISRSADVMLEHVEPRGPDYWVACATIEIDGRKRQLTTAGQFSSAYALRVVARWLFERCAGSSTARE